MVYAGFGKTIGEFIRNSNNPLMEQFASFGGGDLFSLSGTIALGFIHPISIAILGVMFVGFPILSIVGERQRGTLEVLLARPISRHALYVVLFMVGALILALLIGVQLAAGAVSAQLSGVIDELDVSHMPLVWVMGWLLATTFMSVGFAASVSFDRVMPALGLTLVFVLVSYLLEVVGSIWPSAAWVSDFSLFHYVRTKELLDGQVRLLDVGLLVVVLAVSVGLFLDRLPATGHRRPELTCADAGSWARARSTERLQGSPRSQIFSLRERIRPLRARSRVRWPGPHSSSAAWSRSVQSEAGGGPRTCRPRRPRSRREKRWSSGASPGPGRASLVRRHRLAPA